MQRLFDRFAVHDRLRGYGAATCRRLNGIRPIAALLGRFTDSLPEAPDDLAGL